MKNNKFTKYIYLVIGLIIGTTIFVSASSYSSSEISYDTSTSGAVQNNVKDALDFLYQKTKSGTFSECPENMSCIEKPGVTLNVSGPGTVDKGTVYVGMGETNTFVVTPTSGNTLHSISCDNGYTVSGFGVHPSDTTNAPNAQTVTITNPNTANGGTCTITFGVSFVDITITSSGYTSPGTTGGYDTCNSASTNCACWYIKNGGSNFTYGSHTGCNFISKTCKYASSNSGRAFDCASLDWDGGRNWIDDYNFYSAACSGVARCAT